MAEVLIKAFNASHYDPVKDRRGCYKRGDLVVSVPDGHGWGRDERLPRFWRVRIPNVAVFMLESYCAELYEDVWVAGLRAPDRAKRRRWSLRPELLATAQRRSLLRGEIVTLSWSELQRALVDASTSSVLVVAA
jgi:hypothetical protein